jgi:hypothetical protein
MDRTYREAVLEATADGRRTGPMPCQRCGAWVEWNGTTMLNAGTDGAHECWPFLPPDGIPPEERELIADWTRPTRPVAPRSGLPRVRMAHPAEAYEEPPWVAVVGGVVFGLAAMLAVAFAVVLIDRYLLPR